MKIIYKKDTKGKIRILKVLTVGNKVIQQSGLLTSKLTTNERVCKPKNIGKSNATTAIEQAILEAKAIITKKLKEGYFSTIEEAKNHINLMPMLATTIALDKLVYPAIVQPKLDGIRMVATNKSKLSRKNREFDTLDHIELQGLDDRTILDGEVYIHGMSFQEITKLVKKYRAGETEKLQYWVYDVPSMPTEFPKRRAEASFLCDYTLPKSVVKVPSYTVHNEDELMVRHSLFIQEGYEGTMIRTLSTKYEFGKRSKSLIKLKDFIDETYEIIDVLPSDRIPTHGVVQCKTSEGKVFSCGMKMSHKDREYILRNKEEVIGKQAEVRFFEYTDDNIPRFPVYHGTRIDK